MAGIQTKVTARLTSPAFDCAGMQVHTVRGREGISEPFAFDVEVLLPADAAFRAKTTVGQDVQLVLCADDTEVRHVNGIVGAAVDGDPFENRSRHAFRIAPRIHRMTLSTACEVFLDKSVLDVTLEKLGRAGVTTDDVSVKLNALPRPKEFRLQYDETDLAFVARLLERAGIAYFFDHGGSKDVLVLADDGAAFAPAVGPASVPYVPDQSSLGTVTSLRERAAMVTTSHVVNDYLPLHPKLDVCGRATLDGGSGGEIIDFGAGQASRQDGNAIALMRAQARQAVAEGFDGESTLPQIEAGRTIAVENHPYVAEGDRLLVVSVEHSLTQTTLAHADATAVLGYRNRFCAVDAQRTYRPALRTPWPRVAGFAIGVTDVPRDGKGLDTAILDAHGRYTVHLLFDRADDRGRAVSSCRLRMMQPHAGANYGMHFPLKPGIEVAIGFHEGDPDQPFIAGAVPNALTPTPAMDRNARIHHLQTITGVSLKIRDS